MMRFYEHSLVYYLEQIGIPFSGSTGRTRGLCRGASILLACVDRRPGRALSGLAGEPPRSVRPRARRGLSRCCRAAASRKTYSTERGDVAAVDGIDLDVEAGRFAAIIGRSGSGKSSLMAMIGGLSRPSGGR